MALSFSDKVVQGKAGSGDGVEDILFDLLADEDGKMCVSKFWHVSNHRIIYCMHLKGIFVNYGAAIQAQVYSTFLYYPPPTS